MPVRLPSNILRASADTIIAIAASGLVFVIFYPLTLSASAVKKALRVRSSQPREERRSQALSMTKFR